MRADLTSVVFERFANGVDGGQEMLDARIAAMEAAVAKVGKQVTGHRPDAVTPPDAMPRGGALVSCRPYCAVSCAMAPVQSSRW